MQRIRKRLIRTTTGKRGSKLALLLTVMILASCGNNKLVESYTTMIDNQWKESEIQRFSFEIADSVKNYDLFFTIKNNMDYPYYNIYLDYQLVKIEGEEEEVIKKELKEFILFDKKSGKPFGSGSSGLYDHELSLETGYDFAGTGKYEVRFQQYMRKEALNGVAAVGFALADHKTDQ